MPNDLVERLRVQAKVFRDSKQIGLISKVRATAYMEDAIKALEAADVMADHLEDILDRGEGNRNMRNAFDAYRAAIQKENGDG